MLEKIKTQVWKANLDLVKHNLVLFTWGNVSEIDPKRETIVIKPSGIEYDQMESKDMVLVNLDGDKVEGKWNPSSDTQTHIELYKALPNIGAIVHTHSRWATIFSQAGMDIPVLGSTHADTFRGDIHCTRALDDNEIDSNYEKNTGLIIVETIAKCNDNNCAILVKNHGPFVWGKTATEAVYNAVVLEEIANMAWHTLVLRNGQKTDISKALIDKHYYRKHGSSAYYGQGKSTHD